MLDKILKNVLVILGTSQRPMPAYYTSDYNGKEYTKPKTYLINFDDLTPTDEYELASFVWHELPNSEMYKKADHYLSAILIIAEDIIMGSFIINRLGHKKLNIELTREIIERRLKIFIDRGYPSDIIISDSAIREYFYKCERFGKERAKLNDKEKKDLSNLGLAFTDNEKIPFYYKELN